MYIDLSLPINFQNLVNLLVLRRPPGHSISVGFPSAPSRIHQNGRLGSSWTSTLSFVGLFPILGDSTHYLTLQTIAESLIWLPTPLAADEDILVNVPTNPQAIPDYAFSVPIDSIHSIILTPPTLSSWHGTVVINVFCGPTLPKLYFHDDESLSTQFSRETRETRLAQNRFSSSLPASWGGEALLTQLRRFANVCQLTR